MTIRRLPISEFDPIEILMELYDLLRSANSAPTFSTPGLRVARDVTRENTPSMSLRTARKPSTRHASRPGGPSWTGV
jgi:hypothetical protein